MRAPLGELAGSQGRNWCSAARAGQGCKEHAVTRPPPPCLLGPAATAARADLIATYGAVGDYASVITLLIIWSIVLGAFSILEMPLLFVLFRLLILIFAFQVRKALAQPSRHTRIVMNCCGCMCCC